MTESKIVFAYESGAFSRVRVEVMRAERERERDLGGSSGLAVCRLPDCFSCLSAECPRALQNLWCEHEGVWVCLLEIKQSFTASF